MGNQCFKTKQSLVWKESRLQMTGYKVINVHLVKLICVSRRGRMIGRHVSTRTIKVEVQRGRFANDSKLKFKMAALVFVPR